MKRRNLLLAALALGYVVASHVEAWNSRLDHWIKPSPRSGCPLCGGLMAKDHRPSAHLEWHRCTRCGQAQHGVPVREAA